MRVVVQKYGGSSLATPDAIAKVARKVISAKRAGYAVVVVVSAMGRTTEELVECSRKAAADPCRRELDVLMATGEQMSAALVSMAIQNLGEDAISLSGSQCGIITNNVHSNARILEIHTQRIRQEIACGSIVVVAGFQGVDEAQDVTTLGRGGSDTTAIALAAALEAEHCDIFTDVEGIFSANPRVVSAAEWLAEVPHTQMEELAWHGARVLKAEAVEFARDNGVVIRVQSTFNDARASLVRTSPPTDLNTLTWKPRRPAVVGVSGRKDLLRISIDGTTESGSAQEKFFKCIARYDLAFGDLSASDQSCEIFLSTEEIPDIEVFSRELEDRFLDSIKVWHVMGAASVVGFGIGSRPASLYEGLRVLQQHDVRVIKSFTSSRESLSYVVEVSQVDKAVRVMHRVFVEQRELTTTVIPA